MVVEVNVDALVGPSHHFGGAGVGNKASAEHRQQPSSPRAAALQGLSKAELVASYGVPQFVLPPLERPLPQVLDLLGYRGSFAEQCAKARKDSPLAYSAVFSSAFMWAANAGTFAPACDTQDACHHLTLANLSSSWHRLPESEGREKQFRDMFSREVSPALTSPASIHTALTPLVPLRDEGAANHMRLCSDDGTQALHIFVYGEGDSSSTTKRFLPRQTLAASRAVARLLQLDPQRTFFLQQHPDAIDAGVFHNDVIATSHKNLLLYHAQAFIDSEQTLARISASYRETCGQPLQMIRIEASQMSLDEAVSSYFFNSQLLSPGQAAIRTSSAGASQPRMVMICAEQCRRNERIGKLLDRIVADNNNPIDELQFVNLDQSMAGGGGPACLRMRLQLPADEVHGFADVID